MQSKENKQTNKQNNTKYFFYYVKTNVLREVGKPAFMKVDYPVCVADWGKIRLVGAENQRKKIQKLLCNTYHAESIGDTVSNVIKDVTMLIKIARTLQKASSSLSSINTRKILHVLKFLMQAIHVLQTGATVTSLITVLIDFYLVIVENTWKAEMLEQICMASMSMLLPSSLFEIIKRLQYFSTSKLSDDVSGFHKFINIIFEALKWMIKKAKEFCDFPPFLDNLCTKFFEFCEDNCLHVLLSDIKSNLIEIKKSSRLLINQEFRDRIKVLQGKLDTSSMSDWARKSTVVNSLIQDFSRLYKRVLAYENSGRIEPICFVLEGPPGCGKSVALNYLVDLLGKTKYAHTVKDIMDGKDFYDSYNDEEVFYMDDVGQQGISQWRSFINMVSEVKYPLDCADAPLKDTKFFNSEIVLASTNNFMHLGGLTKQDGISNIQALWRRAYVFDFSNVKFFDGQYSGVLYLRSHQTETSATDGGFVNDVPRHMRSHMSSLHPDPKFNYRKIDLDSADPNCKFNMGLWMTSIITMLHKKQVLNRQLNKTSDVDKIKVQAKLDQILNWKPESGDSEFVVGSLGFRISFLMHTIKQILYEQLDSVWSNIASLDWSSIFIFSFIFVVIASLSSMGIQAYNKVSGFAPEHELSNVLKVATTSTSATSHSKIIKHLKYLKFIDDEGIESHSLGLISGHHVLVTSHTIRDTRVVSIFQDSAYSHAIYDKLKFEVVYSNLKEDVAIIRLPPNLATVFSNISHFFKNAHMGTASLNLVVPSGVIPIGTPLSGCVKSSGAIYTTNLRREWSSHKHVLDNNDCFYNFRAQGLCGSVLMDNEQIVGFHVAGDASRNIGVSKLFSIETVKMINSIFECDKHFYIGNGSDRVMENSSVLKLEQRSSAHVATNSSLRPTELYGLFPVDREPANLRRFGPHTVKDIAKKSFSHTKYVPSKMLDFGKEWLKDELSNFKPRKLTQKEVVLGTPLLAGLNKHSSNGFGNRKAKTDYIDFEKGEFTPLLNSQLSEIEGSVIDGSPIWSYFYWVEALKDELRNVEKDGVPRSFRVGTVQHQVLMKTYFGSLVEHLLSRREQNYIMVGCNPIKEWPLMYKKLLSCKGVFAGDIAKWDGAMNNMVQDSIKEIITTSFNSDPMVSFLLEQAIRSIVLVSDDCYITTHSMPSGHYLTAILNSLVNRFYSAMWYAQECFKLGREPKLSAFNNNVIDYVYGDDKLVGIKNEDLSRFNAVTMRDFFVQLGMDFTDSVKNPIVSPFDTLDDVTFLKRSFRFNFDLNRIVCPLDLRTLQNSLSFYDETKDYEVVLEAKIANYFREMFLHPNYNELAVEFEDKLAQRGYDFKRFSKDYLVSVYNRAETEGFDPSLFYWGHVQV
jgi:hypothetical protein